MTRVEQMALQASVPVKVDLHLTVDDSNFDDVGNFHRRFGLPAVPSGGGSSEPSFPEAFDERMFKFRLKFLKEELREIQTAWEAGDLAGVFDGLLDLNYVSHGTAHLLGLPWQEGWDEVQRANMTKIRAESAAQSRRNTGRGHAFDVVKPPDFVPPDIAGVLKRNGFDLTWEVE